MPATVASSSRADHLARRRAPFSYDQVESSADGRLSARADAVRDRLDAVYPDRWHTRVSHRDVLPVELGGRPAFDAAVTLALTIDLPDDRTRTVSGSGSERDTVLGHAIAGATARALVDAAGQLGIGRCLRDTDRDDRRLVSFQTIRHATADDLWFAVRLVSAARGIELPERMHPSERVVAADGRTAWEDTAERARRASIVRAIAESLGHAGLDDDPPALLRALSAAAYDARRGVASARPAPPPGDVVITAVREPIAPRPHQHVA